MQNSGELNIIIKLIQGVLLSGIGLCQYPHYWRRKITQTAQEKPLTETPV